MVAPNYLGSVNQGDLSYVALTDSNDVGIVVGGLSLIASFLLEPTVALTARDWTLIALMGLGPLGAAFYLWDRAIKGGKWNASFVESFLAKERWANDNVALPGEVFRAWVEDIYREWMETNLRFQSPGLGANRGAE